MSRRKVFSLDNLAIARILREIADLLELKNDNAFKIRAYRNGADIAANHPHHLERLDATALREIPGIGKDLAARILEIAQTGDAEYHRELIAEFPPTILDLLHLQGVGPKTVATLYRELDVRTLDDLISRANAAGATAAKVCGAGGGGCLFCYGPPDRRASIAAALVDGGAGVLDFHVETEGLRLG